MKLMNVKLLFCLLFLFCYAWSVTSSDISASYSKPGPSTPFIFNTVQRFSLDFDCNLVSGKQLDAGDPCNGARVCSGSTIRISPRISGRWAVAGNLDVLMNFPCTTVPDYCPAMEGYSSKTETSVKWLNSAKYAQYGIETGGYATIPAQVGLEGVYVYNDLVSAGGVFPAQAVNYYRWIDEPYFYNQKGYADIFCNGAYIVNVPSFGTVASGDISSSISSSEVSFSSTGANDVLVSSSNVKCFAAGLRHPKDFDQDIFRLNFYGYNAPTIPSLLKTSRINVVNIQPNAVISGSAEVVSYSGTAYLLRIPVRNTGDAAIQVSAPVAIPSGSVVIPATSGFCSMYGLSGCPADNGFGSAIAPGAEKSVYVVYSGALSGDIIRLIYEPLAPTCSDSTSFSLTVNIPVSGISRCSIQPDVLTLSPYEIHRWTVACYNSLGVEVACSGNDWSFRRISGVFIGRSGTQATAYITSSGDSGRIEYTTGSVKCSGSVISSDIKDSDDTFVFTCGLIPESVKMSVLQKQDFALNCIWGRSKTHPVATSVTPTDAQYSIINGLDGALASQSLTGVKFIASDTPSDGKVQAIALYETSRDPSLVGAITWAGVDVYNASTPANKTNITHEFVCSLLPPTFTINPSGSQALALACLFDGKPVVPMSADYSFERGLDGKVVGSVSGATYSSPPYVTSGDIRVNATYIAAGDPTLYNATALASVFVIDAKIPSFSCDLTPDSVTMHVNGLQAFKLACKFGGVPVVPYISKYALQGGLTGSLSGYSDYGVTYTAPNNETTGYLNVTSSYYEKGISTPHVASDISGITVVNASTNITINDTDDNESNPTGDCIIMPGEFSNYPGWPGSVSVMCGENKNEACTNVFWQIDSLIGSIITYTSDNRVGQFRINPDAKIGSSGRIIANIDLGHGVTGSCEAIVSVKSPSCVDMS